VIADRRPRRRPAAASIDTKLPSHDGLDGSSATPQNRSVRRIGFSIGAILVLVGMFWAGRESSHGFGALWEHWWCPIPVVAIVVGAATAWLLARRPTQTA
jgi:apolipoprotein N-acyltransferase